MRDSRLSKIEFGFTDELTKVGFIGGVGAALRGAGALASGLSAMGAIRGGQSAGQAGMREGTDNPQVSFSSSFELEDTAEA
ncbi:MAG: hypothetical protein EBU84_00405 [Actinobacteria bacterium]|nr:hypothetical protein [Actinomycetota bacterium]